MVPPETALELGEGSSYQIFQLACNRKFTPQTLLHYSSINWVTILFLPKLANKVAGYQRKNHTNYIVLADFYQFSSALALVNSRSVILIFVNYVFLDMPGDMDYPNWETTRLRGQMTGMHFRQGWRFRQKAEDFRDRGKFPETHCMEVSSCPHLAWINLSGMDLRKSGWAGAQKLPKDAPIRWTNCNLYTF